MIYKCNSSLTCGSQTWTGIIDLVDSSPFFYEAVIQARGSCFHLIAGAYQNGHYLCIPSLGIGCELAHFQDTFWNREQISRYLGPVDTESIVSAISLLPEL